MIRSHRLSLGLTAAALALAAAPAPAQTTTVTTSTSTSAATPTPTPVPTAPVPNPTAAKEAPVDRGYDKVTPKHEAVDAQEAPATATLNKAVAAVGNEAEKINAENQAQYEADRAAYRAAYAAHTRAAISDQVHYDRQQRAYADAMAEWRAQTAACKKGKVSACNKPTPDPAKYY